MKKPENSENFEQTVKTKPHSAYKKVNGNKVNGNRRQVVCQVFSGCRCTICGGFFEDGGDTCSFGHTVGHTYIL